MSLDAAELTVGANGSINIASYGTTLPTDIDEALHADFLELGYVTEDGVTFKDGKTIEGKKAWQSFYDVRKIVTARDAMVKFTLEQWNRFTVILAFGGGAVTDTANGVKYEPPNPEDIDERSAVIAWTDGDKDYRIVIPKCIVADDVETNLKRTDLALLPITLGVIGVDGFKPWTFLTNDPNWELTGTAS